MKTISILIVFLLILVVSAKSQLNFDEYKAFRSSVENIDYDALQEVYPPVNASYYKGYNNTPDLGNVEFFNKIAEQYDLTSDEIQMIRDNHFVVCDRLNYSSFGEAYLEVFKQDLPMFLSSDLVLHALHMSYDLMLKDMEMRFMATNLYNLLEDLYDNCPRYITSSTDPIIKKSNADIDLYVSIAYSLISGYNFEPHSADVNLYYDIMNKIEAKKFAKVKLFVDDVIDFDFSQFTVRGHYAENQDWSTGVSLANYFKAMMWLGRVSFDFVKYDMLTNEPIFDDQIKRNTVNAFVLNKMLFASKYYSGFELNNKIVDFLVGESDNITPAEFKSITDGLGIKDAKTLLTSYNEFVSVIEAEPDLKQKILGNVVYSSPNTDESINLPIVYKMSGQRYIIDSEILTNMVYDRIIYNNKKVMRMMPEPLDVLYALGNDDALNFLKNEIDKYHYATNLATQRYLVDAKPDDFWRNTYYSGWLKAIRELNPKTDTDSMPFFMRTAAWHQQKMNTQLASWTQLRHDNVLYAKPSYTGGVGCSYPYVYIEPYPDFYHAIYSLAQTAVDFFDNELFVYGSAERSYFLRLKDIMQKLETISQKELDRKELDDTEQDWLRSFIYTQQPECGVPEYTGWMFNLFLLNSDCNKSDLINVDIHTQPTDESGNAVGNVLHGGLGKVDMGTFIIKHPLCDNYVAYVGAFMSYYKNITKDFKRLTDEEWQKNVAASDIPERPEWTATYLANATGNSTNIQYELPNEQLVGVEIISDNSEVPPIEGIVAYPVPVQSYLNLVSDNDSEVFEAQLFDMSGKKLDQKTIVGNGKMSFDAYQIGLYLLRIKTKDEVKFQKILKR